MIRGCQNRTGFAIDHKQAVLQGYLLSHKAGNWQRHVHSERGQISRIWLCWQRGQGADRWTQWARTEEELCAEGISDEGSLLVPWELRWTLHGWGRQCELRGMKNPSHTISPAALSWSLKFSNLSSFWVKPLNLRPTEMKPSSQAAVTLWPFIILKCFHTLAY